MFHQHGDLGAEVLFVESKRLFAVAAEVEIDVEFHGLMSKAAGRALDPSVDPSRAGRFACPCPESRPLYRKRSLAGYAPKRRATPRRLPSPRPPRASPPSGAVQLPSHAQPDRHRSGRSRLYACPPRAPMPCHA